LKLTGAAILVFHAATSLQAAPAASPGRAMRTWPSRCSHTGPFRPHPVN